MVLPNVLEHGGLRACHTYLADQDVVCGVVFNHIESHGPYLSKTAHAEDLV